nr:ATP-binding protein [Bacteroidales bacterium]
LLEVFYENFSETDVFFFDEIQNVKGWEKFINRLFGEGKKVFVTGSNARLLSSEFATALTGRHLKVELFPFSFKEYLSYKKFHLKEFYNTKEKAIIKKNFNQYLEYGGFPEVLKSKDKEELSQIYRDILIKDLIVRFGIKETKAFRELALYLLTNITSNISYNNLKKILAFNSVTTVKNYIDYLEESYLMFTMPKYDFSLKKQIINNRKIYTIDTGLFNAVSFSFSENRGKQLENIVFLELKRKGKEIYYHNNKYECDFIVRKGSNIQQAIQVSESVYNAYTRERELRGLAEALSVYKLNKGIILTYDEEEEIKYNGYKIMIIPIWKWLLSSND